MSKTQKKTENVKQVNTLDLTEKGRASIKHLGENHVEVYLTAKPSSDSPVKYQMRWLFNFSECSREELEEIAANYLKIRQQDAWRMQGDYENPEFAEKTFNVKQDILSKKRANAKDPVAKVKKQLANLSKEEKEQLKALLEA